LSPLRSVRGRREVTLKGEVVDVTCYSKQGVAKGTGPSHVSCALDCAKQGKPLGLLTDGDGLFKFVGEYAGTTAPNSFRRWQAGRSHGHTRPIH